MGRLDGKVALITGGSRGQGAAEARLFAAEGANVVIGDVRTDQGEAVAAEIGERAVFTRLDVSSEEEWAAAIALTTERFGGLDVLVNNAGIGFTARLENHTLADWEKIVAVNQTGVFLGIRSAIAPMTERGGGSIVNISSGAGLRATKYMIAYAATKYAVTGMTASAAIELARNGIRVNSIHPGVIDTPMLGRASQGRSGGQVHAAAADGHARGDRQRGPVPGQRRLVVHDRRARARGRWRRRLTPARQAR